MVNPTMHTLTHNKAYANSNGWLEEGGKGEGVEKEGEKKLKLVFPINARYAASIFMQQRFT
jgi:hypothetical protein